VGQLKTISTQINQMKSYQESLNEDVVLLHNKTHWLHDTEMSNQRYESNHKMVVKAWPGEEDCSEEDRIRVEQWIMAQFARQYQILDRIRWEHSRFTGRNWILNATSYIKFDSEEDKSNFARWAYTTYSGKKPLVYWDINDRTLHHRGSNSDHRIIFAPYISKMDRLHGAPLQVVAYLLTKGGDFPHMRTIHRSAYDQKISRSTIGMRGGLFAKLCITGLTHSSRSWWSTNTEITRRATSTIAGHQPKTGIQTIASTKTFPTT
jgi:hypothetical protein